VTVTLPEPPTALKLAVVGLMEYSQPSCTTTTVWHATETVPVPAAAVGRHREEDVAPAAGPGSVPVISMNASLLTGVQLQSRVRAPHRRRRCRQPGEGVAH